MIEELRIRGLGVIEDATLPLGPGLTVVTGETGAGKTMVVTGLLLLFGGRADADRVRSGADQASVDGRVALDPQGAAAARAIESGGELDADATLILRRTVAAAGRSRAYVGGAPAPVGVLADLADSLLTVHGQSDQLRLTKPAEQRAALDRFARLDLAPYQEAYRRWRDAEARLSQRRERARELRREADLLEHGLADIEAAELQPGEDVELAARAARLAAADALRIAAGTAHDALLGNAENPLDDAADVMALLGRGLRAVEAEDAADPELAALTSRLRDLVALAADVGADLGAYADGVDANPAELAATEARRAAVANLTRRYGEAGEGVAGVLAWAEQARLRLGDLDVSDEALATLAAARDTAADQAAQLAAALSKARASAAEQLAVAVTAELAELAMNGAGIDVIVRRRASQGPPRDGGLIVEGMLCAAGADGVDDVELLLRARPDAPALAVGRSASGGELSRVMLALEVSLAGTEPVPTLVFDEIDAGVGGRAAVEVGRRLARLGRDHQVLVVTHLAQVAAHADQHIVVDKPSAGVTHSDVRVLTAGERIGELARMLAGSDTPTARRHAQELLDDAAPTPSAAGKSVTKKARKTP